MWHTQALLALPEQQILVKEEGLLLEARQSRSHEFCIDKGVDLHAIDVTVTIVSAQSSLVDDLSPSRTNHSHVSCSTEKIYQGTFGVRGYRLGRMAAMLYRLQESVHKGKDASIKAVPNPIGFGPQELQSLNTPDSMGKIVIHHSPHKGPINPGTFKVRKSLPMRPLCYLLTLMHLS